MSKKARETIERTPLERHTWKELQPWAMNRVNHYQYKIPRVATVSLEFATDESRPSLAVGTKEDMLWDHDTAQHCGDAVLEDIIWGRVDEMVEEIPTPQEVEDHYWISRTVRDTVASNKIFARILRGMAEDPEFNHYHPKIAQKIIAMDVDKKESANPFEVLIARAEQEIDDRVFVELMRDIFDDLIEDCMREVVRIIRAWYAVEKKKAGQAITNA